MGRIADRIRSRVEGLIHGVLSALLAPVGSSLAVLRLAGPFLAGPFLAGPLLAGALLAGPPLAGPLLAGPLLAGPLLAGVPQSGQGLSEPPLTGAALDQGNGRPVDAAAECVILLHGLWRTQLSMLAVEWKLETAGFQVINRSYSSLTRSIQENALLAVSEGIRECRERGLQSISFVTHSLGGILVRQYLSQYDISGLHRVVMMGPPNQGSELADYVASLELLSYLQPQALEQLGTGKKSVPLRLGPVAFELGVIAGNAHRRDFLPGLPEGPGDGTVSVSETLVRGMADFIELPVSHTLMMWDEDVLDQVLNFLRYGKFCRGDG